MSTPIEKQTFLLPLEGQHYANLALDRNFYKDIGQRESGICFMLRARNEEETIFDAIESIHRHLDGKIEYQVVFIDNGSTDCTEQRARASLRKNKDILVSYPVQIAKAGLETYVTPCNSVHSLPWFYQFCLQQCTAYSHVFKWDADFLMTEALAKKLVKIFGKESVEKPSDAYAIKAQNEGGDYGCELYLFAVRTRVRYQKYFLWEFPTCKVDVQPVQLSHKECIVHNSTLKTLKSYLLLQPWWETESEEIRSMPHVQSAAQDYDQWREKLGDIQLFCRSRDPACNALMRSLPHKVEEIDHLIPFELEPLVFQIGMHKTATCALNNAFVQLGIPSMHVGPGPLVHVFEECIDRGLPYQHYRAFTDFLWIHNEEALQSARKRVCNLRQMYCNAKFVLNVRHVDDWLHSHLANTIRHRVRTYTTNQLHAIKRRWYEWHAFVLQEFETEPERLLVFDIERDDPLRLGIFCVGQNACPKDVSKFWKKVYVTPPNLRQILPLSTWWQSKSIQCSEKTKKSVTAKMQGGLGNQLFILFAMLAYAREHDRRAVLRTFENYGNRSAYWDTLLAPLMAAEKTHSSALLLAGKRVETCFLIDEKLPSPTDAADSVICKEKSFAFAQLPSFESAHVALDGYFQSRQYFCAIEDDIVHLLFAKDNLVRAESCFSERVPKTPTRRTVSVHVRRGDYTQAHAVEYHGLLSDVYYAAAIEIMNEHCHEVPHFLVFSDDIAWCREQPVFAALADRVSFFPSEVPDWLALLVQATQCRAGHIIANSSFSWWAAYLGWLHSAKHRKVIAPSQWFAEKGPNGTPVLDDWLRIDSKSGKAVNLDQWRDTYSIQHTKSNVFEHFENKCSALARDGGTPMLVEQWKLSTDMTYMLEHETVVVAQQYVDILSQHYDWETLQRLAHLNDRYGGAAIEFFANGLLVASPSTLRYTFHAHELLQALENRIAPGQKLVVIEVGAGYGGLALILHSMLLEKSIDLHTYYICDLRGPAALQRCYLTAQLVGDHFPFCWKQANELSSILANKSSDHVLLLSNYGISSMLPVWQEHYCNLLAPHADTILMHCSADTNLADRCDCALRIVREKPDTSRGRNNVVLHHP